jgi:hypothetical protein
MRLRTLIAATVLLGAACAAQAHEYTLGMITIGHPYARSTVLGQPTGGAYLRLDNRGAADRLVSVRADVSRQVQLHISRMEGEVMHMREVDAIDLPAHQAVQLQPGGTHIMLVGLKAPLKVGESFPMTLKFEKAGEVKVEVKVQAADPTPMKH